jgi:quinol monooxygenase YgiN
VTVQFVESWESEEGLKRHVRSDRFVTLAGLMESATEAPRVEFALPGGTRGLDYAGEVRRQAPA